MFIKYLYRVKQFHPPEQQPQQNIEFYLHGPKQSILKPNITYSIYHFDLLARIQDFNSEFQHYWEPNQLL